MTCRRFVGVGVENRPRRSSHRRQQHGRRVPCRDAGEVTIIDAGVSDSYGDTRAELEAMGRSVADIRALVLTSTLSRGHPRRPGTGPAACGGRAPDRVGIHTGAGDVVMLRVTRPQRLNGKRLTICVYPLRTAG
jgi:hypothetical protein